MPLRASSGLSNPLAKQADAKPMASRKLDFPAPLGPMKILTRPSESSFSRIDLNRWIEILSSRLHLVPFLNLYNAVQQE